MPFYPFLGGGFPLSSSLSTGGPREHSPWAVRRAFVGGPGTPGSHAGSAGGRQHGLCGAEQEWCLPGHDRRWQAPEAHPKEFFFFLERPSTLTEKRERRDKKDGNQNQNP